MKILFADEMTKTRRTSAISHWRHRTVLKLPGPPRSLVQTEISRQAFHEIELEVAEANAEANDVVTDKEDLSEETDKRAVTLVPGLPAG
jgi:hypothetical protein